MRNDSLEVDLLKTDDDTFSHEGQNPSQYKNTKKMLRSLCKLLSADSVSFQPKDLVDIIDEYIKSSDKLDRILYSEISSHFFGLESKMRGRFLTNIEDALMYVLEANNVVNDDTMKIIVKMYDHTQLASHQIENVNNIFEDSIDDAKEKLHAETKGIEREYVTILGIFAAIVLAFVGGITFTTSVLNNINKMSIFRLLITIDAIGVVLINTIFLLMYFIYRLNDKEIKTEKQHIKRINCAFFIMAVIITICWLLNLDGFKEYLSHFLKWGV
ncbi:hypothetical protein [Mogibacterium sp. CM50]|uniref:hypothetical protein n=1 Tax=Mogibacterium sp. CM50 TaxID=936375 RepID=UPI00027C522D|nr:hypothetical protein [Mogibacterium sp. CM50]EJU23125.1 hypothetical protein HMPREF1152_1709 [Mogibacterium sp. CM50]